MSEYIKEVRTEYGVYPDIIGGGFADRINEIEIGLVAHQNFDINNSRKLAIALSKKLLKKYNDNEKARPFLKNYPFNDKNITIYLTFRNRNEYVDFDYVAFVLVADGKIYYNKRDKVKNRFVEIYEEPFEKALKIVNNEKSQ
jgi:hypothetical protein